MGDRGNAGSDRRPGHPPYLMTPGACMLTQQGCWRHRLRRLGPCALPLQQTSHRPGCAPCMQFGSLCSPRQELRCAGDWDCPSCNNHNFASRAECFKCGTVRPAGSSAPPSFNRGMDVRPGGLRRSAAPVKGVSQAAHLPASVMPHLHPQLLAGGQVRCLAAGRGALQRPTGADRGCCAWQGTGCARTAAPATLQGATSASAAQRPGARGPACAPAACSASGPPQPCRPCGHTAQACADRGSWLAEQHPVTDA